jgi:hypothetical protein
LTSWYNLFTLMRIDYHGDRAFRSSDVFRFW